MDRDTERQDSGLGPPGGAALRLIAEGLGAALGRLEAAGVVLACDAGDLPTTAVQQAALEERTEAVTAELRRLPAVRQAIEVEIEVLGARVLTVSPATPSPGPA
ncbi:MULTISPECIES: hypothetical protein [unclassified Frankia]